MGCFEESPDPNPKTEPREMRGWYMYDWANSPYFQVYVVGVFPVFVKWLAEAYAAEGEGWTDKEIYNCTMRPDVTDPAHMTLPGLGISAGSFPVAVGWITTVVQMVCLLSFSAFGDYGAWRKKLMMILTWIASGAIVCNIFCFTPTVYWLAGLLRIIAGACFVMCVGYYNSYLPLLMASTEVQSGDPLTERIRLTDAASAKGNLAGYAGGVVMLFVSFALHWGGECDPCGQSAITRVEQTDFETNQIQNSQIEANRIQGIDTDVEVTEMVMNTCSAADIFWVPALSISIVGLWWAGFSAYTFYTLKTRPGPAFPKDGPAFMLGWKDAYGCFKDVVKYKQTLRFVIVYFISSDSLATLIGNAFLIMEEHASASTGQWTTLTSAHINFILGAFAAFVGIFLYQAAFHYFHLKNKTVLTFQFCLMTCVAIACVSGGLESIGFIGVMAPVSLTVGSMQSITRSIYTNLIPQGKEASMFAFYEITDKGSNLIGAAVTVLIHTWAHSYIHTMWYIMLGFASSAVILYFVDVEQGMAELGKAPASDEKGTNGASPESNGNKPTAIGNQA